MPPNTADGQLGFTLHTITGFHRPNFTHYYGVICHLAPTPTLSLLSHRCFWLITRDGVRLPQLLCWLPVRNSTLKHKTGLTEYRASRYFARLPSCLAESGSLSLCTSNFLWLPSDPAVGQQRPCHSDYLVRVIQVSFNLTGLPASLGKQKSRFLKRLLFNSSIYALVESGLQKGPLVGIPFYLHPRWRTRTVTSSSFNTK